MEKEEEQASYNLINNLIKEEKALLQQQKEDEQLAKSLSEKFKNTEVLYKTCFMDKKGPHVLKSVTNYLIIYL